MVLDGGILEDGLGVPAFGDDRDVPGSVSVDPAVCPLCGFPLDSFKHRSLSDKGILGHEPEEIPAEAPKTRGRR